MSTTLGSVIRLPWAVTDASGAAADAAVTLVITLPDGSTVSVASGSITHGATGVYSYDFVPTLAGRHLVRWTATGTATDARDDVFEVEQASVGPILGLADMKRHLNITRTTDDAELYEMGRAISSVVESYLGFPIRRRTVVESRDGGGGAIYLRKAPCSCSVCAPHRLLSVSSVVEYGIPLAAGTDYLFDADTGALRRGSFGRGVSWVGLAANDVVVTYAAGYSSTPPWARLAFLRALENVWQRSQQSPHPGLGQPASVGDDWNPSTAFALPYAVQSILAPHRLDGF